MHLPERFSHLPEYAFPRLRRLLDDTPPGGEVVQMTIGEPRHAFPDWLVHEIAKHGDGFGKYPPNEGTPGLRLAISDWITQRYAVAVDPETQVMVLNGTREGLFNTALALCPEEKNGKTPIVLTPNPFYQVYAIAALAAGAEALYIPATKETGFLPDYGALKPETLDRVAIAYICSPANPQGSFADEDYWRELIALAEKHNFRIFADECYSEVYRDVPPPGALQIARQVGAHPERVVIFHSLSKRSNLPGLRSGFVAGGPKSIAAAKQLRAYSGAPLPLPLQQAAESVWRDETHVVESRNRYRAKYQIADVAFAGIDDWHAPDAGFFLWLPVEDGEEAALKLWTETGVRVLPGAYLAREVDGFNPGKGYIRVAMVVDEDELKQGLETLRDCILR